MLRNGTNWSERQGFIENETRSGKTKRRLAHYMGSRPFSVQFHFSPAEYQIFRDWYINTLLYGTRSFLFPAVDSIGNEGELKEYRIAEGNPPSYSNPFGDTIECNMEWEEV